MSPMKNQVIIFLVICWAMVDTGPVMAAETTSNKNVCAMTDVLVAMKELLIMLSGEIRDLKKQVYESCQSNCRQDGGGLPTTNQTDHAIQEIDDFLEATNITFTTITTLGLDNLTTPGLDNLTISTTIDPSSDYYDDYNDTDVENPLGGFIEGIANLWGSLSPFAPKPSESTTTAVPDVTTEEPTIASPDDETTETPVAAAASSTTTSTTTTTTTTTELPYTLPPAPTSCPNPFRLTAGGCYLIIHDARDWKSWGDAHSMCQSYGGSLAAPWRLSQLQDYLSRHYSDAFWVGARFIPASRSWQWLSGRNVEKSTWKLGQPSRNPGKKCVFLDKWSGYHGNNFFCGEKYPFICDYRDV